MVRILLPTMAAYERDIQTMFGLLEKIVGKKHEIGLEVIGKPEHFEGDTIKESFEQIKENVRKIAKGLFLSIHGFSGNQIYKSRRADMTCENGLRLLQTYSKLANDIEARYVHIHSSVGYTGERQKLPRKAPKLDKIRKNMLSCLEILPENCSLGIENVPSPAMGDEEPNPKKVGRDIVDCLEDCLYIVKGTDLKVTLDTCHYGASRRGKIDLMKVIKKLNSYLIYSHISDVGAAWVPYKSIWKEGVVLGEGRIGEESFKEVFKYIKDNRPDMNICVEVWNKDFQNPKESEESIKRVVKWLE